MAGNRALNGFILHVGFFKPHPITSVLNQDYRVLGTPHKLSIY